jgi:hypothetical protein
MFMKVYIREVQKAPWYFFVPIILVTGLIWYGFIQQIVFDIPFGTNPASDTEIWILLGVLGILLPIFFLSIKLTTEVQEDGIYVRFSPFVSRFLPYKDIKQVEACTYNPLSYGGWGIRWSPKKGWAYNMRGNKGVLIELKNGKQLLIGSEKPEELVRHIKIIKTR